MAKYNVRKANHLIEIEERMSKSAQLWVSYLVACLPKAQEGIDDFPTLEFSFKEIKNMINADGKKRVGKVMDIHKLNKELMSIPLWYESDERAGYVSWLTDAFLDKKSKDQKFIFRFHPGLKPYLLNLKQHYTYYNFFYRVCLSKNSMKFYEILKSKQYLKEKYKRSIELNIEDDIKYPLGLTGKYDKYYDFRRKVLDICQSELEKFTDIRFTYEPSKKEWNRVVSILINIERNIPKSLPEPIMKYMVEGLDMSSRTPTLFDNPEPVEVIKIEEQYPTLFKQLTKWGGNKKVILGMIEKFGISKMEYQINHIIGKEKQGSQINDKFGWFRKAVENDYKDLKQDNKQKKAVRAKERKNKVDGAKLYEESLKALKNEKYGQSKALSDKIIQENPDVLVRAVKELKEKSHFMRRKIQDRNLEELYNDKTITGSIISTIESFFPKRFNKIQEEYITKEKQLKNQFK